MNLPDLSSFNRVVIIDDSESDGLGIRGALDSQKVPSLFINAKQRENLPKVPFPNVRLVILDLDMISANSVRDKANYALTCLNSIIGPNSFYVLAIWSTHTGSDLEQEFLSRLDDGFSHLKPCVVPISLSKTICKNRDGRYSAHKINYQIKSEFKKVANYALFTKWEATINEVMSDFLNGTLSNENQHLISKKLHALAEAYAGRSHQNNIAKNALLALNDALKGSIDGGVIKHDYSKENAKIHHRVSRLSPDIVADINTKLMVNPEISIGPGCLYESGSNQFTSSLIDGSMSGCVNVMIDVTPICDVAQDKNKFSYYIHGALVIESTKVVKKAGYCYQFRNLFKYQDRNVYLVVNLKSLESLKKQKWDRPRYEWRLAKDGTRVEVEIPKPPAIDPANVLFKLRDNVVVDFQHKIAAYNARPGHVLLS